MSEAVEQWTQQAVCCSAHLLALAVAAHWVATAFNSCLLMHEAAQDGPTGSRASLLPAQQLSVIATAAHAVICTFINPQGSCAGVPPSHQADS